jgi:hypothetical protein
MTRNSVSHWLASHGCCKEYEMSCQCEVCKPPKQPEIITLLDGERIYPESWRHEGWLRIDWGAGCVGEGPVDKYYISTNGRVVHFRGWHPTLVNPIACVEVEEVKHTFTRLVLHVLPREYVPEGVVVGLPPPRKSAV